MSASPDPASVPPTGSPAFPTAVPTLVPCVWSATEAEAAAEFYVSVFPGSSITSVSRWPDGPQAGMALTVEFTLAGRPWVALNGGTGMTPSPAVSFQVPCADQDEVDHYWWALTADGGRPGRCGWLEDRFGVSWQIVPTRLPELLGDPGRAARALEAMMPMSRLVIAELEAAADAQPG
ncbi:VOC family protein [Kineococcus gynurae]|uniref:VOC family protein n=1 Tax=Kineococcus gynurae TaxID=452979 RepID=A0ABV5LNY5_9ACTN